MVILPSRRSPSISDKNSDGGEVLSIEDAQAENGNLYAALDPDDTSRVTPSSRAMKTKKLVSQCILECVSLDRELGLKMLAAFRDVWLAISERNSDKEAQTMEEYLKYRSDNGGMLVFWPMLQFSLGMSISKEEEALVQPIIDAATEGLLLANDFFSWEREYRELQSGQSKRIVSAVDLFIRTQGLSIAEAKDEVRRRIIKAERDFCQRRDELYKTNPGISLKIKRWIESAGLAVSGNHYWCSACPRQNAWKDMGSAKCNGVKRKLSRGAVASKPKVLMTKRKDSSVFDSEASPDESGLSEVASYPFYKSSGLALEAPSKYVSSMPSKGVRSTLIEAFNTWLHVPSERLQKVMSVIDSLHNASLILDDIEDNSPLRRGFPATHILFGQAQSINSANFMFVRAVQEVSQNLSPAALVAVLEELEGLYLGQSWDLYWKHNLICPSEAEYVNMIDHKTGGMFRMLLRIMQAESDVTSQLDFHRLTLLFGRFFQIRDDYMNFQDYTAQKGLCEDLDEGKFSYPVVYCLENFPEYRGHFLGVFRQRPTVATVDARPLSRESKLHLTSCLKKSGAFDKTMACLMGMEHDLKVEIDRLERQTGEANPMLRLCLAKLSVEGICISLSETLPVELTGSYVSDFKQTPTVADGTSVKSLFWAQQQQTAQPVCIINIRSAEDVAAVVSVSHTTSCPFAVRGGGHSDIQGASNINGGITVNMAGLSDIELDEIEGLVKVGAGATWGDVYNELQRVNMTVVGGRLTGVGVGGLLLGGGLSHFSGLHGWACDNVRNYEVVLANGSRTTASESSNPDLFRALRGGGNSFGVVTRFDLDVFKQGPMWGGLHVWPLLPSVTSTITGGFVKFAHDAPSDPNVSLFAGLGYMQGNFAWAVGQYDVLGRVEPPIFTQFKDDVEVYGTAKIVSTARVTSVLDLADELNQSEPAGMRSRFTTATFDADAELLVMMADIFIEQVQKALDHGLGKDERFAPMLGIQPLTQNILKAQGKRGGNVMGLHDGETPLVVCSFGWEWSHESDDTIVISGIKAVLEQSVAAAKKRGLYHPFKYMNYAAMDQDPIGSYGENNIEFLKRVREAYDAEGVFAKLVPGGHKID
ncbi:terpenoid synthase [Stemphylium lycopersici]|uniref:Terpenoid synthase n=1 Tax=Stemphylium lycopersici TaxID=183478 RepID=A0A364MSY0_STELY|nr:terpenoid synthase [Stemphylium lycopersici]RAR02558.1 terpenoid synthase [Stemphylium lycopersici]